MLDILGLYRFMRRQDGADAHKHGYNENPFVFSLSFSRNAEFAINVLAVCRARMVYY